MKHIPLKTIVAVSTFIIGLFCFALWYLHNQNNEGLVSPVFVQNIENADSTVFETQPPKPISRQDYKKNGCQIKVEHLRTSDTKKSDDCYYFAAENKDFDSLKEKLLPQNSAAIRIWVDRGIAVPLVFGMERINDEWSAWHIENSFDNKKKRFYKRKVFLSDPKSGYEVLWVNLQNLNVTSLPDASQIGDVKMMHDGQVILVETVQNGQYRNFAYTEPLMSCLDEAKKLVKIIETIENDFGIRLI